MMARTPVNTIEIIPVSTLATMRVIILARTPVNMIEIIPVSTLATMMVIILVSTIEIIPVSI